MWIAYDSVSGDMIDSGSERKMKRLYGEAGGPNPPALAASKAEWRRIARELSRTGMSGNPAKDRTRRA